MSEKLDFGVLRVLCAFFIVFALSGCTSSSLTDEQIMDGNLKYDGTFSKGEYHGKGTLYNEDGSVKAKGAWKKGVLQ